MWTPFKKDFRDAFYMNLHILFIGPREMIPPKDLEYMLMIASSNTLVETKSLSLNFKDIEFQVLESR